MGILYSSCCSPVLYRTVPAARQSVQERISQCILEPDLDSCAGEDAHSSWQTRTLRIIFLQGRKGISGCLHQVSSSSPNNFLVNVSSCSYKFYSCDGASFIYTQLVLSAQFLSHIPLPSWLLPLQRAAGQGRGFADSISLTCAHFLLLSNQGQTLSLSPTLTSSTWMFWSGKHKCSLTLVFDFDFCRGCVSYFFIQHSHCSCVLQPDPLVYQAEMGTEQTQSICQTACIFPLLLLVCAKAGNVFYKINSYLIRELFCGFVFWACSFVLLSCMEEIIKILEYLLACCNYLSFQTWLQGCTCTAHMCLWLLCFF